MAQCHRRLRVVVIITEREAIKSILVATVTSVWRSADAELSRQ